MHQEHRYFFYFFPNPIPLHWSLQRKKKILLQIRVFLKPTLQKLYVLTFCSIVSATNFAKLNKSSFLKLSQMVGFSRLCPQLG